MRQKLMFVELKTGYSDNGPAWIGKVFFSKSGQTIYFNGITLKGSGKGNCREIESGDIYWTSGIKKNGEDRHWAGDGKIKIDRSIVMDYLKEIGQKELPKNKFILMDFDNNPQIDKTNKLENQKI
jgi:hypothetical protein